jgi:hypothetical protein
LHLATSGPRRGFGGRAARGGRTQWREDDVPFELERSSSPGKKVLATSRPGQHRFSFRCSAAMGPSARFATSRSWDCSTPHTCARTER